MTRPDLDHLPADILSSLRGVVWNFETRDGAETKVPYCARRPSDRARVDDPSTWAPFLDAVAAVEDGKADGAGVVLGAGLFGVDLDGCRDPQTGALTPEARAIVEAVASYTEISPSGCGVHIFAAGTLPPGRRRHGQVEMYADGRYFTVTGQHLAGTPMTIEERTAAIATVHAQVFVAAAPAAPSVATEEVDGLTDAALLVKASAAQNGARFVALFAGDTSAYSGDDSAADLALANILAFWTRCDATQMDRLFRQSGLMREKWDSRRQESTYGALTIARAIADCRTVYTPAITIEIDDASSASADSTTDDMPPVSTRATDTWPILSSDALVGVFGDLVHALAPETEADPVALLGHALVFWGSLVGRTPFAAVGAVAHHLNENVLIVGHTSSGRKGMAEGEVRSVMAQVDGAWAATRLVSGLSSGEGLIHHVRDPLEGDEPIKVKGHTVGHKTVIQDAGVDDKRLAVVESEFGRTLRVSRREGNTLSAVLRQAWDHGDLRVLTRHAPVVATGAHIAIVGHITPQELRQELRSVDMASGFINRFLILLVRRSQYLPNGGAVDPRLLDPLVRRLMAAMDAARRVGLVQRDPAANLYWADVYPAVTRERPGLVGAVCTRAPAHILRVSLLYALADGARTIALPHVKAALALVDYAEASARAIFHTRTGHKLSDYLLAVLRRYPQGQTRTELSNALGRNRGAEDIHEALQRLLEYGLARHETVAATGVGRPTVRWFANADFDTK